MKTAEIVKLKKNLLIIEMPEDSYPEVTSRLLAINNPDGSIKIFKGFYTLLGKSSEISEDDVKELVESWESVANDGTIVYENYKNSIPKKRTALESFHSALESEIYWDVNPYDEYKLSMTFANEYKNRWEKAELRTFERNRSIILVKN